MRCKRYSIFSLNRLWLSVRLICFWLSLVKQTGQLQTINFGNQIDIIAKKNWTKPDRIGQNRTRKAGSRAESVEHGADRVQGAGHPPSLPPSLKLRWSKKASAGNAGHRAPSFATTFAKATVVKESFGLRSSKSTFGRRRRRAKQGAEQEVSYLMRIASPPAGVSQWLWYLI